MNGILVKELDLKEFRGIRKLAKPIKLTKFNVIIGRNNTGKTAILEAIYLLSMPYTSYNDPIYNKNRIDLIAELHGGTRIRIQRYSNIKVHFIKRRESNTKQTSCRWLSSPLN